MSIAWLRDLVIVVFGLASTIVVIILAIVAVKLYRKVVPIIESAKKTTKTAEDISSVVRYIMAPPLSYLAAVLQGLFQAFKLFGRFKGRKEGS